MSLAPDFVDAHRLWQPSPEVHEGLLRNGTPETVLVSAPMGGNKSETNRTILQWIHPYDLAVYGCKRHFLVSKTTRSARDGEIDGVHYDFETPHDFFEPAFADGRMLEIDHHGGEFYGTPMPTPGRPHHLEIEVRGFRTACRNMHPDARHFVSTVCGIYIVQGNMAQLIDQILNRPGDPMPEQKRVSRACRYVGELAFALENNQPYHFIENVPGNIMAAPITAVRVVAGDQDAPTLTKSTVADRRDEALEYLFEHGLEPGWIVDDPTK